MKRSACASISRFARFVILPVLFALYAFSVPAFANCKTYTYQMPHGVVALTEEEVRQKVVGHTVDGWPQFRLFFHTDGTMEYLSRGLNFGKWYLCDNVFIMEGRQRRERLLSIPEEGKISFYDLSGVHQGTHSLKKGKVF